MKMIFSRKKFEEDLMKWASHKELAEYKDDIANNDSWILDVDGMPVDINTWTVEGYMVDEAWCEEA